MYHKYITHKEFKYLLENSSSNVRFVVYYISKGRRVKAMKPKKSITIGERVERLETKVDQLGTTVDKLVIAVSDLTKVVNRIDTRLNYIVQANNLKDLPRNKM